MTPIGEPLEPGEDNRFEQRTGGEEDGPTQDHPVPARPTPLVCRPRPTSR
ncbi:hypothetical protein GCM10010172_61640 [Paractinoplanes ferrugineus]|uniref:Uncharacterized protein n=1 Tax=Paractinoplanes ferrugineus TaxID=113564 RepID=A0A919MG63_9ACTN|nr:hypothetical protein Afe05nite_63480 [Actinoplanes ferrugineus]